MRIGYDIPKDLWLSSNVNLNRYEKARRVRELRAMSALVGGGAGPVSCPVDVLAVISYPTARKADPPNAWPTVKALMDGLTDAGLWPDDNSDYIPLTAFRRGPRTGTVGYHITLDIRPARTWESSDG